MSTNPPCIVLGMPRSRTAWLSAFLSTPERLFVHEPIVGFTCRKDLHEFLDKPNAAACDSGMTLLWREIVEHRPDVRLAIIMRDVREVHTSFINMGFPVSEKLMPMLLRTWNAAYKASEWPHSFMLMHNELNDPEACRMLHKFAHGVNPPKGWVKHWQSMNVQCNWRETLTAMEWNKAGIARLFAECQTVSEG